MLRTLNCTAWVSEADKLPKGDGGSSPFADEGTLLHNCAEEYFTELTAVATMLREGRSYGTATLTKELVDTKLIPAIMCINDLGDKYDFDPYAQLVEPFVELIPDESGGSIDMLAFSRDGKTAIVIDYKFGHITVKAEENAQMMFYALCADVDPSTTKKFKHVENLVLVIVQPNDDGPIADIWETPIAVLDQFEVDVYQAIEKSKDPQQREHVAGGWCKYCPALATCPTKTGAVQVAMRLDPRQAADLSKLLKMIPDIEAHIKAASKLAYEQLSSGVPIDGFKMVNKRASRVWADEEVMLDKVRKMKRIKLEDALNSKLKSPAQMEKLFAEKGVDKDDLSDYIVSVSSGTTVAKSSDKRPDALPTLALKALADRLK